ncbi:MAG TPA: UDP-N-acetylmuramoyl-tripeptide--D-alanyl-D-alanine ligase [Candidatus Paceibacterota bacterium]
MKSFFKKIISLILEIEARVILRKYRPFIIGITGSVGKTSTKDAIYTVLSNTSWHVRKSQKSFNSEIGVPLTILGCENGWSNPFLWIKNILQGLELIFLKSKYPDCLVLEIGADRPGDIRNIAKWLKLDIAVMTKISAVPVHVEFFPSSAHILEEKSHLIRALKKDGILILYYDDQTVLSLSKGINQKILTYGINPSAVVNASNHSIIYEERNGLKIPLGMTFKLNYEGNSVPITIYGGLGIQQIYPLLAGASVGISRQIILTNIINSFAKHIFPPGRMNIIKGINDSTIIDDTYNSSPDALRQALVVLGEIKTIGRKIAILGDMLELGKFSVVEHIKAGDMARQTCSIIITVGQRMKKMGENIISFNTAYEASEYARGVVGKGDVVLIKGSQSIRMERVVKDLMAEPEKAKELLTRQEPEWLAKK